MTGIYHLCVKIISRGSGRSAVGAAAYRAGEKLQAVRSAAYRSGEGLRDEDTKIEHDYTRKQGVVYKEILLPENAPPEYADRETLWNAVEASEKRVDARLAREIEVALQIEFDLEEQKEVLREYVKENFVEKGMVADLAIHNKGDGNPHAHIMLTTRNVTPEGFGNKNRDWDKKENLLIWRENWADKNNRKFEEKGLDERIDHRTLKAQGIDREPTIHLGHEAAALEKRGVRTERGDRNREIKRRNEERANLDFPAEGVASGVRSQKPESAHNHAAHKAAEKAVEKAEREQESTESVSNTEKSHKGRETEKTEQNIEELRKTEKYARLEEALQEIREAQKTARYMEKPSEIDTEIESESPFISELEKQLKAEKAMQYVEKMYAPRDAAKTAEYMNALKEKYIALENEKNPLIARHNKEKYDIPDLEYRAESLEEYAGNIEVLRRDIERLQECRRDLRLFDVKKKKDADEKIAQATQELDKAQGFFKNNFHVDPSRAAEELERLQEEIRAKKEDLNAKKIIVTAIRERQAAIELEYHTQKLLAEIRPDRELIDHRLEQLHKTPETVRDRLTQEQVERQLNTIGSENFQAVINNLPPYQARILTEEHNRAEAVKREQEKARERENEKNRAIDRSR